MGPKVSYEFLQQCMSNKIFCSCSIQVYHDLESWLTFYPHFLPNFIYSWPSTVYEKLFTVINPFYSISRAALLLNTVNGGTVSLRIS